MKSEYKGVFMEASSIQSSPCSMRTCGVRRASIARESQTKLPKVPAMAASPLLSHRRRHAPRRVRGIQRWLAHAHDCHDLETHSGLCDHRAHEWPRPGTEGTGSRRANRLERFFRVLPRHTTGCGGVDGNAGRIGSGSSGTSGPKHRRNAESFGKTVRGRYLTRRPGTISAAT